MKLNDYNEFQKVDQSNLIEYINTLPLQLKNAYTLGMAQSLPKIETIQTILLAGVGTAGLANELIPLSDYISY